MKAFVSDTEAPQGAGGAQVVPDYRIASYARVWGDLRESPSSDLMAKFTTIKADQDPQPTKQT